MASRHRRSALARRGRPRGVPKKPLRQAHQLRKIILCSFWPSGVTKSKSYTAVQARGTGGLYDEQGCTLAGAAGGRRHREGTCLLRPLPARIIPRRPPHPSPALQPRRVHHHHHTHPPPYLQSASGSAARKSVQVLPFSPTAAMMTAESDSSTCHRAHLYCRHVAVRTQQGRPRVLDGGHGAWWAGAAAHTLPLAACSGLGGFCLPVTLQAPGKQPPPTATTHVHASDQTQPLTVALRRMR